VLAAVLLYSPAMPRALIVEDDEPIRSMLALIIRHHGFDVDTAEDGGEAIESIDSDGFDVVLLDLMMPNVDGYAVLKHMNDHDPNMLRHTIIATAVPERDLRTVSAPVFAIHTKPFELDRLIDDVKSVARAA